MLEGDAAAEAVASAARRTTARRDLAREPGFAEVSPEVGVLDPEAFDSLVEEDPDSAVRLLAEMVGATDERLRELAARLAAQVVVELAGPRSAGAGGVHRLEPMPLERGEGDLDLERSLDAVVQARAGRTQPSPADLTVRAWRRAETAVCLLVDRSGSMAGERLATAAVAAAAVALRAGADCSVVAFSGDAIVLASQGCERPAGEVAVDLCRLRGGGVTDLSLALQVAGDQLARSRASRHLTILLSDCRSTTGEDAPSSVHAPDELVVLAPAEDVEDARTFAEAVGSRWAPLAGPSSVPEALDRVLRDR